jgi:hypothetical protein
MRWNGSTGPFEASYAFLGGFGTGAAHSSTFIAVTVATTEEELAIAGGGLYLCGGVGSVLGVAAADSTLRAVFKSDFLRQLGETEYTKNIMARLLEDIRYLSEVTEAVRFAAVASYGKGFKCDFSKFANMRLLKEKSMLTRQAWLLYAVLCRWSSVC